MWEPHPRQLWTSMPLIRLQTPRPWHRSLHSSLKLLLPRPPTRLWLPRRRSPWLPPPCPLLADLRQPEAHRAPSPRYLLTTPQIQRPWPGSHLWRLPSRPPQVAWEVLPLVVTTHSL